MPILVFAGAVAAGAAIGWSGHRGQDQESNPVLAQKAETRTPAGPKWGKEDFLKSIRSRIKQATQPGHNPFTEVFADWTDDEIRSALEESLVHPECLLLGGTGQGLDSLLLREWMRRDLDAVIDWHERLDSLSAKRRLAVPMGNWWPTERASEGLTFVLSNRGFFPGPLAAVVLLKNLEVEARKGPAAVESLLRIFREENFDLSLGNPISLPPDFDHRALLEGEEYGKIFNTGMGRSILQNWVSTDRDEAFDWLVETQGGEGLRSIMDNPSGIRPDELRWLAGRIEDLDTEAKSRFVDSMSQQWILAPFGVQAFMEGLSDPVLRGEIQGLAAQSVFAGRTHNAMPIIETISDPERRIALLESAEPDALFSRQPYRRAFDAENEALLRRKLGEWNAGEDRIEAILSKYRK